MKRTLTQKREKKEGENIRKTSDRKSLRKKSGSKGGKREKIYKKDKPDKSGNLSEGVSDHFS